MEQYDPEIEVVGPLPREAATQGVVLPPGTAEALLLAAGLPARKGPTALSKPNGWIVELQPTDAVKRVLV